MGKRSSDGEEKGVEKRAKIAKSDEEEEREEEKEEGEEKEQEEEKEEGEEQEQEQEQEQEKEEEGEEKEESDISTEDLSDSDTDVLEDELISRRNDGVPSYENGQLNTPEAAQGFFMNCIRDAKRNNNNDHDNDKMIDELSNLIKNAASRFFNTLCKKGIDLQHGFRVELLNRWAKNNRSEKREKTLNSVDIPVDYIMVQNQKDGAFEECDDANVDFKKYMKTRTEYPGNEHMSSKDKTDFKEICKAAASLKKYTMDQLSSKEFYPYSFDIEIYGEPPTKNATVDYVVDFRM